MLKLSSCPLCKGRVTIVENSCIQCTKCGCVLPKISGSMEETVLLWNSRIEFLSCPLCGEYAYKIVVAKGDDVEFSIHCVNCGFHTKTFKTEEEAIHAWNSRANLRP